MRIDGRTSDQLRPVELIPNYLDYPEGSALISMGKTRVLCSATIEEAVPRWMQLQGAAGGWITAEYAMLPRATQQRTRRETDGLGGRTQEIRRLVGRSLRAAINLELLGARTITIDCDVVQADGGTRAASITGGYVAMAIALRKMIGQGVLPPEVLVSPVAAISAGIIDGLALLDLCYAEDSRAGSDFNVVMNSRGEYIEVQGTAEGKPFSHSQLDTLLKMAYQGIGELLSVQKIVLERVTPL